MQVRALAEIGESARFITGRVRGFFEDGPIPAIGLADYGVFEWRGGRLTKMPSIPYGDVTTRVIASDGSLWFCIENQGLYLLKDGQLTQFESKTDSPENSYGLLGRILKGSRGLEMQQGYKAGTANVLSALSRPLDRPFAQHGLRMALLWAPSMDCGCGSEAAGRAD